MRRSSCGANHYVVRGEEPGSSESIFNRGRLHLACGVRVKIIHCREEKSTEQNDSTTSRIVEARDTTKPSYGRLILLDMDLTINYQRLSS